MISSKQFSVDRVKQTLTAEISELGVRPFVRMYSDACDEGIEIYSDKTGKVSRWVIQETCYDDDGDITCWKLEPTGGSLAHDISLATWTMKIFND